MSLATSDSHWFPAEIIAKTSKSLQIKSDLNAVEVADEDNVVVGLVVIVLVIVVVEEGDVVIDILGVLVGDTVAVVVMDVELQAIKWPDVYALIMEFIVDATVSHALGLVRGT